MKLGFYTVPTESNPGPSRGSPLHYRCATPGPQNILFFPKLLTWKFIFWKFLRGYLIVCHYTPVVTQCVQCSIYIIIYWRLFKLLGSVYIAEDVSSNWTMCSIKRVTLIGQIIIVGYYTHVTNIIVILYQMRAKWDFESNNFGRFINRIVDITVAPDNKQLYS